MELKQAKEQWGHISCRKCKLLLNVEISKESIKQIRKKGSHAHDTEDDLVSAESMLQKELSNSKGCKCWEGSCRFSLLSVLTEIGNHTKLFCCYYMWTELILFQFCSLLLKSLGCSSSKAVFSL